MTIMTTSRPAAEQVAPPAPSREIREAEFARRLEQACDAHSQVPPKHSGRLTWIQRQLKTRGIDISVETVRKWFAGEAKARPDKLIALAELLEVDEAWLSLGVDHDLTVRSRAVRNAMADGAVNVVAGLIQMDGGLPAFPAEDDKDALDRSVDLHAIIRGGKYDIHVALGTEEDGNVRFVVPTKHDSVVVLGLIKQGMAFQVYDLSPELIATGHRKGMSIEVVAPTGSDELRPLESFKQRL